MNEFTHVRVKPAHAIAALLLASALGCGGGPLETPAPQTHQVELPQTQEAAPPPTPEPPTTSPTVEPGSFADFHTFAGEIDQALRNAHASFFTEHASISVWDCIGDEAYGVCRGQPPGSVFEGIPVSDEWQTFTFFSSPDYEATWQQPLQRGVPLRLHAIATKFGENPLMPLAAEALLAVVTDETTSVESSPGRVRVLFFEYRDRSWWLQGELQTTQQAQEWLQGDCFECYDQWTAWPH